MDMRLRGHDQVGIEVSLKDGLDLGPLQPEPSPMTDEVTSDEDRERPGAAHNAHPHSPETHSGERVTAGTPPHASGRPLTRSRLG